MSNQGTISAVTPGSWRGREMQAAPCLHALAPVQAVSACDSIKMRSVCCSTVLKNFCIYNQVIKKMFCKELV